MAVIRNLVVKISADISSLSKGLQNAQKSLQKVSQSFTKIGGTLTATITGPLVALGTSIVKTSAQFEQSMANAASVAGATGEELQRMTDIAREMGSKTVFSASDAADALYYMASAGYKVDQMAASIEATLNLASATQYDLAATTDIVIATLNQFGLEASSAERVTNVFASAIGNSMA
jgi:TP901 family phage tail tape measure protein